MSILQRLLRRRRGRQPAPAQMDKGAELLGADGRRYLVLEVRYLAGRRHLWCTCDDGLLYWVAPSQVERVREVLVVRGLPLSDEPEPRAPAGAGLELGAGAALATLGALDGEENDDLADPTGGEDEDPD